MSADSDQGFVLDTPDAIAYYQLLVHIHRLKLEVRGLRFRLPTLKSARALYGIKARTRKAAIPELEAIRDAILAARQ